MKNAEMWVNFLDNANARRKAGNVEGIPGGWGNYLKSREGRAMAELGMFTALTQFSKVVVPRCDLFSKRKRGSKVSRPKAV